jgi:hypothetical protein
VSCSKLVAGLTAEADEPGLVLVTAPIQYAGGFLFSMFHYDDLALFVDAWADPTLLKVKVSLPHSIACAALDLQIFQNQLVHGLQIVEVRPHLIWADRRRLSVLQFQSFCMSANAFNFETPRRDICTFNSAWIGLFTEEVVCGFVGSLSLFSSTSSTSVKSVPVEDGATGEGSTMLSGAFGDGGARCACFSLGFTLQASVKVEVVEWGIGTHMAVTGPGINAGLGESGLSEKGENAEMRALADEGCLKGERTAIIMAAYATCRRRE